MKRISLSILAIILFFGLKAEEPEPVKNIFLGTRFINLHSTNLAKRNELQYLVQHRFGDVSEGIYQFFGLDMASMRMALEYGFTDNFMAGIGRSGFMKTYDTFLKYRLFNQTADFPVSVVASVAGSVPTIRDVVPEMYDNFSDKASGDIQVHLSKSFESVGLQLSPGFIYTGYVLEKADKFSFFTLGAGGSVKLSKKVSANIEYLYRFENELSYKNPLSVSVDIKTSGHLFQLIVSNTQQMYNQAIITNASGNWAKGNLFLGFNLIRGFDFKKYY